MLWASIQIYLLRYSVYALVCFGIWLSGYALGGYHCRNANEAKQAKAQDQAIAKANEQAKKDLAAALEVERKNQKTEIVYRTITEKVKHEVEKPVYRDCVIDANGLRLWNDANAGTTEANTASKSTR